MPSLRPLYCLYGDGCGENRRVVAREQLRAADAMLAGMRMDAFAERAAATGETVRKRTVQALDELTPQEVQVARLAAGRAGEPGDRCPAVPQRAHGGMAPGQGIRNARGQLP